MALSDNLIEKHRIAACDSGPLHFSAAMRFARAIEAEARRDALEEAAKLFDGEGEEAYSYHAAERIRKLKEDIQ